MAHFWHNLKHKLSGTSVRYMYDGINGDAASIHRAFPNAAMVAGYVDGTYAWSQADWNLFPNAVHVRITAIPGSSESMSADVADCESGDYTPATASSWAHAKRAAGYERPTIYCSESEAAYVRAATGNLILQQDYDIWMAWYVGHPFEYTFSDGKKAVASQYTDSGGFYDESSVYDSGWPHRTGSNPPPPPPPPSSGPYWHEVPAGNTQTLEGLANSRSTTVANIVSLTQANADAGNMAILNSYVALDNALAAMSKPRPGMPEGLVYYTSNP